MTRAWIRDGLVFLLGLGCLVAVACARGASAEPWVLVDTERRVLAVMDENGPLETFDNIALGRRGAGAKEKAGDDRTPLGVFRVGWISGLSRYGVFIGLDYPNLEYAERGLKENRIDLITYHLIRRALAAGRTPPQDTPLGGFIGIHGIGAGDPRVHQDFDWTRGCVAMSNRQIRRLAQLVQVGTRVEIR